MKLSIIIKALRDFCPTFERRVYGLGQYANLPDIGRLDLPAAYVLPAEDEVGEQRSQNDYRQRLKENFYVAVVVENKDYIGQPEFDEFHHVRSEVWKALLGWQPEPYYGGITYAGFEEANSTLEECHYLLKFSVETEISPEDTRQAIELSKLPPLNTIKIKSELQETQICLTNDYGS
ncbi:phage tail terminator protein [Arsenophonus nasoniae]|uniref:Phage protein n=1 Tax=Arsenophonus nasoniae TaxID=638 RepID=A0A4P7L3J1_9GAMM|nr:hypothetical protein [Arsenophonus nasoniae]QBY46976.1 hypothetical protein ArsFIN_55870 [Arsenophonus nasoniae]